MPLGRSLFYMAGIYAVCGEKNRHVKYCKKMIDFSGRVIFAYVIRRAGGHRTSVKI